MLERSVCGLILAILLSLAGPAQAAPEPIDREMVEKWLVELGEAYCTGRADAVSESMSPERLWEEIRVSMGYAEVPGIDETQMLAAIRIAIRLHGEMWASALAFVRHELLDVKIRAGGSEATVLARHWGTDGEIMVMRWWVVRGPDGLLLYDFEELMTSMRASYLMGAALSAGIDGGNRETTAQILALTRASNLLAEEDYFGAAEILDQVGDVEMADTFEALKQFLFSTLRVWEEEYEAALFHIARARKLTPDMPALDYLETVVQNRVGNYERALVCARAFLAILKNDPDGRYEEGYALYGLGRGEEAAAAMAAGLEVDPGNVALLGGYGVVLPSGKKGDFADRFAKRADAAEVFETIILEIQAWGSPETERVLIACLRKLDPEDPNADYYEAELLVIDGDYEKAAAMLRGAIPRAPDDETAAYVDAYLGAMAGLGRHAEAYREFPGEANFDSLFGDIWFEDAGAGPLSLLIVAHAEKFPEDPNLHLARAEFLRLTGDAKGCVDILLAHRAELAERPDYIFVDMLIHALAALERFDEALAEAKKSTEEDDDPWFEAVVHAAAKRPAELATVLRRLKELGYSEFEFYEDRTLGPALRSEPFAGLREEFPPPE